MIDVIIPCLVDDLKLLKLSIDSIRKNVIDNIKSIYIVSPKDYNIINFCNANNLIFVDENSLFDFTVNDINKSRPGWIFQQLIKLYGEIGECENYLCIDADHILLKPHKFINDDNTFNFYFDEEYHIPYFNNIKNIFKNKYDKFFEHSFISDKMLFNKKLLAEMKTEMEQLNNDKWYNIILNCYNCNDFSEFETYGTWLYYNYNKLINLIYCNRLMSFQKIEDYNYNEIQNKYNTYSSITQHKYAV